MRRAALLLIPVILCAQGPAPPDAAELTRIVAALRKSAMRYQGHLPDFICTKVTTRSLDESGTGTQIKQQDVLEERVAFSGGQAVYTPLTINGRKTKKKHSAINGVIEDGLLGMAIVPAYLLGPRAPVTFEWSQWDTVDGKPAYVIAFRVAPSVINRPDGKTPFLLGFHGLAWVGVADNNLVRLEEHSDPPPGYPIRGDGDMIDYGMVDISGTPFLLPVKAMDYGLSGKAFWSNSMEFIGYRKFGADANIRYIETVETPAGPAAGKSNDKSPLPATVLQSTGRGR